MPIRQAAVAASTEGDRDGGVLPTSSKVSPPNAALERLASAEIRSNSLISETKPDKSCCFGLGHPFDLGPEPIGFPDPDDGPTRGSKEFAIEASLQCRNNKGDGFASTEGKGFESGDNPLRCFGDLAGVLALFVTSQVQVER